MKRFDYYPTDGASSGIEARSKFQTVHKNGGQPTHQELKKNNFNEKNEQCSIAVLKDVLKECEFCIDRAFENMETLRVVMVRSQCHQSLIIKSDNSFLCTTYAVLGNQHIIFNFNNEQKYVHLEKCNSLFHLTVLSSM